MTDTSPDISNPTSDKPEDWQEGDDLPVAQVRELFVVFVKALRSFQLYDEQNPVRKRFVNDLREDDRCAEVWHPRGRLPHLGPTNT